MEIDIVCVVCRHRVPSSSDTYSVRDNKIAILFSLSHTQVVRTHARVMSGNSTRPYQPIRATARQQLRQRRKQEKKLKDAAKQSDSSSSSSCSTATTTAVRVPSVLVDYSACIQRQPHTPLDGCLPATCLRCSWLTNYCASSTLDELLRVAFNTSTSVSKQRRSDAIRTCLNHLRVIVQTAAAAVVPPSPATNSASTIT